MLTSGNYFAGNCSAAIVLRPRGACARAGGVRAAARFQKGTMKRRKKNMADLDWSQCPAVESVPGKVSGAWTFRNSRTPVKLVFENLEDGMTIDEIVEQYPVSREEIKAVLEFAARGLDKPPCF